MTDTIASFPGIFVLVAAPFVGSFVATLAVRWPEGRPVITGRSACRSCANRLAWRDLVPVLSWLVRRGRCAHCGAPVSQLYPLSELGALAVAVWAATAFGGGELVLICLLGWALLALALIDLRSMLLPDFLTGGVLILGLIVAALRGTMLESALAAAAGFVVFATLSVGYRLLRGRDGLGLGDAKLLAAAGAWVGLVGLPGIVLMASAGALLMALPRMRATKGQARALEVAFGPYLAAATWVTVLYGPVLAA